MAVTRRLAKSLVLLTVCLSTQASCLRGNKTSATSARFFNPSASSCVALTNQGSFSTVKVQVGSPPQSFDLVADTGSDYFIVADCTCQSFGGCKAGHCFTGTNRSSTFKYEKKQQPLMVTFGSGTVSVVAATDVVRVGTLSIKMEDSVMLMYQSYLNIAAPMEGILGLGIPKTNKTIQESEEGDGSQTQGRGGYDLGKWLRRLREIASGKRSASSPVVGDAWGSASSSGSDFLAHGAELAHAAAESAPAGLPRPHVGMRSPHGFLQTAGVKSFSMCFNEDSDGALRLNSQPGNKYLGSMGTAHWGLDLRGISIGNHSTKAVLCHGGEMRQGQETQCGLIPDSGTTYITGPQGQVAELFGHICDRWPRCRENFTALEKASKAAKDEASSIYGFDPFGIQVSNKSKAAVFKLLLADCGRWLEGSSLLELPSLHFDVAGTEGETQTLEITGWAYVLESGLNVTDPRTGKKIKGKGCTPAIGMMDYVTAKNGPVWIVGTPLFYEYQVGYSLAHTPPAVSFTSTHETPCGSCDKDATLVSTSKRRFPRQLLGEPRFPTLDTSMPL